VNDSEISTAETATMLSKRSISMIRKLEQRKKVVKSKVLISGLARKRRNNEFARLIRNGKHDAGNQLRAPDDNFRGSTLYVVNL